MDVSYLQDLSRESKRINEKIKALTEERGYHHDIVCAAPHSETMLKIIDRDLDMLIKNRNELTNQAKEARLQIAINEGFTLKNGGMKK